MNYNFCRFRLPKCEIKKTVLIVFNRDHAHHRGKWGEMRSLNIIPIMHCNAARFPLFAWRINVTLKLTSLQDCGNVCIFVAHSVYERKVIRVIVTSTMIKLGQCNPHPLHHRQGWKREQKKESWGHHHQNLCTDLSMGTLERALLSPWVGNRVVVGLKTSRDCFDVFFPPLYVCALHCYNLDPCILPAVVSMSQCCHDYLILPVLPLTDFQSVALKIFLLKENPPQQTERKDSILRNLH